MARKNGPAGFRGKRSGVRIVPMGRRPTREMEDIDALLDQGETPVRNDTPKNKRDNSEVETRPKKKLRFSLGSQQEEEGTGTSSDRAKIQQRLNRARNSLSPSELSSVAAASPSTDQSFVVSQNEDEIEQARHAHNNKENPEPQPQPLEEEDDGDDLMVPPPDSPDHELNVSPPKSPSPAPAMEEEVDDDNEEEEEVPTQVDQSPDFHTQEDDDDDMDDEDEGKEPAQAVPSPEDPAAQVDDDMDDDEEEEQEEDDRERSSHTMNSPADDDDDDDDAADQVTPVLRKTDSKKKGRRAKKKYGDDDDDEDDYDEDDHEGAGYVMNSPSDDDDANQITPVLRKKDSKKKGKRATKKKDDNRAKRRGKTQQSNFSPKGYQSGPREFRSIPVSDTKDTEEGLRRSKRTHRPPTAWWKNEGPVWGPNDGDLGEGNLQPVVKAYKLSLPTPYTKRKVGRAPQKTRAAAAPAARQDDVDDEEFDNSGLKKKYKYIDGQEARVWDDCSEQAEYLKLVAYQDQLETRDLPATKRKGKTIKGGKAAQAFNFIPGNPYFSGYIMGSLRLPPRGVKEPESAGPCSQTFTVVSGQRGAFEVAYGHPDNDDGEFDPKTARRFLLSPGDMFRIPPGNCYSLENHSKHSDCLLTWTIVRANALAPDEEDASSSGSE